MSTKPDVSVEEFGEKLSDAILALPGNPRFQKSKQAFLDALWDDIQFTVIDQMGEQIEQFVRDMAQRTVDAMLKGQDDQVRRYLGLDGWNGRDIKHEVIHGTLFETGAVALRRDIVKANADLIQNERIKDLEAQVASLVEQVNEKQRQLDNWRDEALADRWAS